MIQKEKKTNKTKQKEKKKKTDCGTNWESSHLSASSTTTSEVGSQPTTSHKKTSQKNTSSKTTEDSHEDDWTPNLHHQRTSKQTRQDISTNFYLSTQESPHKHQTLKQDANQVHEETGPYHLSVAGHLP